MLSHLPDEITQFSYLALAVNFPQLVHLIAFPQAKNFAKNSAIALETMPTVLFAEAYAESVLGINRISCDINFLNALKGLLPDVKARKCSFEARVNRRRLLYSEEF